MRPENGKTKPENILDTQYLTAFIAFQKFPKCLGDFSGRKT